MERSSTPPSVPYTQLTAPPTTHQQQHMMTAQPLGVGNNNNNNSNSNINAAAAAVTTNNSNMNSFMSHWGPSQNSSSSAYFPSVSDVYCTPLKSNTRSSLSYNYPPQQQHQHPQLQQQQQQQYRLHHTAMTFMGSDQAPNSANAFFPSSQIHLTAMERDAAAAAAVSAVGIPTIDLPLHHSNAHASNNQATNSFDERHNSYVYEALAAPSPPQGLKVLRPHPQDVLDFAMAEDREIKEIAGHSEEQVIPRCHRISPPCVAPHRGIYIHINPENNNNNTNNTTTNNTNNNNNTAADSAAAAPQDVSLHTIPVAFTAQDRDWAFNEVETNERHLNYPTIKLPAKFQNGGVTKDGHRRLEQRRKQLMYGKDTDGYRKYISVVPHVGLREFHNPMHPITPRPENDCSKRTFDKFLNSWRRMLHQWDAVDPANVKAPFQPMGVATLGDLGLAEKPPQDYATTASAATAAVQTSGGGSGRSKAPALQSIAANARPSSGGSRFDCRSSPIFFPIHSNSPQISALPVSSRGSMSMCTPSRPQGPELDANFFSSQTASSRAGSPLGAAYSSATLPQLPCRATPFGNISSYRQTPPHGNGNGNGGGGSAGRAAPMMALLRREFDLIGASPSGPATASSPPSRPGSNRHNSNSTSTHHHHHHHHGQ